MLFICEYTIYIYVENDFILDNFFLFERLLNTIFLNLFMLYYFLLTL